MHRDIKPENMLLSDKELGIASLKIADFGLARTLKEDSMASTTCGTPGYVAPEVLMQQPYGKECDYWSICVVCFILLSGSPPFYNEDNYELFDLIKQCKYDFDPESWSDVSPEAKDFVSKILVSDPKERLNCDQMLNHPWMTMEISGDVQLNRNALDQYVKIRDRN